MEQNLKPKLKPINNFQKRNLIDAPYEPSSSNPQQEGFGVHTDVFIVSPRVGDRLIRPIREPKDKDH